LFRADVENHALKTFFFAHLYSYVGYNFNPGGFSQGAFGFYCLLFHVHSLIMTIETSTSSEVSITSFTTKKLARAETETTFVRLFKTSLGRSGFSHCYIAMLISDRKREHGQVKKTAYEWIQGKYQTPP
jgi:hypothetical protein